MKKLVLDVTIACFAAAALVNAAPIVRKLRSPQPGPGKYVAVNQGGVIEARVRLSSGPAVPLSRIAPGQCVYLVITSPTCGAGAAEARHWKTELRRRGSHFLGDWVVAWTSIGDSASVAAIGGSAFPVPFYHAEDDALARVLGITAFPIHVVLGRDGRVVASDIGAPVPSSQELQATCGFVEAASGGRGQ